MQVVYGLFSRRDNQPAQPGADPKSVKLGWGVVGTEVPNLALPFSAFSADSVDLSGLEAQIHTRKVIENYRRMSEKDILRALVGQRFSFFWCDNEQMGWDFHRGENYGGASFSFPAQEDPPVTIRPRGTCTRVDARSLTVYTDQDEVFRLPRGIRVLDIFESKPGTFVPEVTQ